MVKYFKIIFRKENNIMKKRLFILIAIAVMAVCLFAVSASAQITTNIVNVENDGIPDWDKKVYLDGNEYALWELDENGVYHPLIWFNNGTALESVRADNIRGNGADVTVNSVEQVIYRGGDYAELQGIKIHLASGTILDGKSTIVIANLNGVGLYYSSGSGGPFDMDAVKSTTFMGSTALKYIYLPSTINTVAYQNGGVFQGCTSLEAVIFAKDAKIGTIGNNFVINCSSLKCVSLPSSVTKIAYNAFNKASIGGLYLGETLEEITSGGNYDAGAFYNCKNLYFVQNPFEYYGYEGTLPEKSEIYFFPNTLATVSDHAFRGCPNTNTTVVFGTSLTSWSGHMFTDWTSSTSGDKNVIFLGNMTRFSISETISGGGYIHFYFPNTTDKSVLTVGGKETYVYYYTELGYVGRARYNGVTWLTLEELQTTTNSSFSKVKKTPHLEDPRLTKIEPATCYSNATGVTQCFCKTVLTNGDIPGTKLDHTYIDDFDCTTQNKCKEFANCGAFLEAAANAHIEKHAVAYADGFASAGLHTIWCDNEGCNALDDEITLDAIFGTTGGYAISADGGLAGGWTFNATSFNLYNLYNENDIKFGVLMANPKHLASNKIFSDDMSVNLADGKKGALIVDDISTDYSSFKFSISGFVTEELQNLELIVTAFAYVDGEDVEFIQAENTACKVTTTDFEDGTLYTVNYTTAKSALAAEPVDAIVPSKDEE